MRDASPRAHEIARRDQDATLLRAETRSNPISMVTRYGSRRGENYGSMGAVDFWTRGGRDAGRRHELRRYRKSLVGCSPCRAAPKDRAPRGGQRFAGP